LPAQPLSVPAEIPAAPRDLAVDDQYLWVATSRGLVRWRLEAIAP
jgi:ligand-binding sensor domain-containing protein